MAIGPNTTNKTITNKVFKSTLKTKTQIQENIVQTCKFLSIGMSKDYILALQNGATHIRLGTILYKKGETSAQ